MALTVVLLLWRNGAHNQNINLFVCLFIEADKLMQEVDSYTQLVKQVSGSVKPELSS
jgi:hypothetical protein